MSNSDNGEKKGQKCPRQRVIQCKFPETEVSLACWRGISRRPLWLEQGVQGGARGVRAELGKRSEWEVVRMEAVKTADASVSLKFKFYLNWEIEGI
jgi:hypothetical protein